MATINKQMKTFNVPSGSDTKCYEIVDDKGRKCLAKDWATNSSAAYAAGEYVIKDGVVYKFKTAHTAGAAWSSSEVEETNLGDEITGLKSAIGTVPTGKTVQGQIEALQTGKADMIVVTDSTPAAVMTFPDGADDQPMALKVAVEPVQDLHGYENPWPGGGGKNILPSTLQKYKADNVNGTWSGNDYSINGLTFSLKTDNGNNIIEISVNGTASSDTNFNLNNINDIFTAGTTYHISGCPSGGSASTYYDSIRYSGFDIGNGATLTPTQEQLANSIFYSIAIKSGTSVSNIVFKPMICLNSEADKSFAPYSNICPISGWTGANVSRTGFNVCESWENTSNKNAYTSVVNVNKLKLRPNTTYCVSFTVSNYTANVGITVTGTWRNAFTYIQISGNGRYSVVFTTNSNVQQYKDSDGVKFLQYESAVSSSLVISDFCISLSSDRNGEYEPFAGYDEYSITFPSTAGTVYGGTLTLNQDGTGSLVVDRAGVDMGTVDWTYSGTNTSGIYEKTSSAIQNLVKKPSSSDARANIICSRYAALTRNQTYRKNVGISVSTNGWVYLYDPSYNRNDDTDAFEAAVSGQYLVYELATPVTYTLTPGQVKTLLGVNNVWADTGDILSVDYPADTKLYIDKLIANLQALVLENIGNT